MGSFVPCDWVTFCRREFSVHQDTSMSVKAESRTPARALRRVHAADALATAAAQLVRAVRIVGMIAAIYILDPFVVAMYRNAVANQRCKRSFE
jgi:hypothetical protein